jgi:hypothetical protein
MHVVEGELSLTVCTPQTSSTPCGGALVQRRLLLLTSSPFGTEAHRFVSSLFTDSDASR